MKNIEKYLARPHFRDRAQTAGTPIRYIDQYVAELKEEQKELAKIAAISARILFNSLKKSDNKKSIEEWLNRFLNGEEFISAYGYREDSTTVKNRSFFQIDGYVRKYKGFPYGSLTKSLPLQKGLTRGPKNYRKIDFEVKKEPDGNYIEYWKVRNTGNHALRKNSLRGEICKDSTLNNPEVTEYKGTHYVTCYLVDICKKKVVALDCISVKII